VSTRSAELRSSLLPFVLAVVALPSERAEGQTLHSSLVASGLAEPTNVVAPPGDEHRLFVTEQHTGRIRIARGGAVLAAPYLDAGPVAQGGEQGLLGLAFHPGWQTNGKLYVYVTTGGNVNVVREYRVANPAVDVAGVIGTTQVLAVTNAVAVHNGGCLAFGPDGYLYVAKGDGGPGDNGQDAEVLLGKILRIDVDGDDFPADATRNYAIPPSNPFAGATPGADEVWHLGLRNPWRFAFDRATGDMLIADVGQGAWEEIDFAPGGTGGLNFGWSCLEGTHCTSQTGCSCSSPAFRAPIREYGHALGCSVTGGCVYRGSALPALQGTYFYADFCTSSIWSFRYTQAGGLTAFTDRTAELDPAGTDAIANVTSFGEDARGELLIVAQSGEIWRVEGPEPGAAACAGDGTLATPCPCANEGAAGRGCGNSAVPEGALLSAVGSTNPDTVFLTATGVPATTTCVFLAADGFAAAGAVFGDGVLCLAGTLRRVKVTTAVGGAASYPRLGELPVSQRSGVVPGSGAIAWYQVHYRNSATFCTPATFNVSSGYRIVW
jgi:glucose/arabinose dehydrogenase